MELPPSQLGRKAPPHRVRSGLPTQPARLGSAWLRALCSAVSLPSTSPPPPPPPHPRSRDHVGRPRAFGCGSAHLKITSSWVREMPGSPACRVFPEVPHPLPGVHLREGSSFAQVQRARRCRPHNAGEAREGCAGRLP